MASNCFHCKITKQETRNALYSIISEQDQYLFVKAKRMVGFLMFVCPHVFTELAKANEYCRNSYTVCEKLQKQSVLTENSC